MPRTQATVAGPASPANDSPLDVVIVGAGQAGLAVGHHLARRGVRFLIVDAGSEIGHVWRSRWDSLTLFTPAEYCSLPGTPFPAAAGTYPTKDQVADYLTGYVEEHQLPVQLRTTVHRLTSSGGLFHVDTSQGRFTAHQVVVATGPFQSPAVPRLADGLAPEVTQIHSAQYRNPDDVPGHRVLVVGGGNSGLQIATELAASRQVHVALGSAQTMVPQRPFGRDLFWWLTRTGFLAQPSTSFVARRFRRRGGDLVIGTSTKSLVRAGVTIRPRLTCTGANRATFADGSSVDVDAVVWATGFRSDYGWIDVPGVWDGRAVTHVRGRTAVPGLSFIGLPWQHTRGSALLGFVKDDAEWLVDQIASAPARKA
jgi:putative flavoprotein involved in K+ transport